jgi:hypothetical protein
LGDVRAVPVVTRVLLFVAFDGAPRFAHRWKRVPSDPELRRVLDERMSPRAWWLVECENAAAGREVIARAQVLARFASQVPFEVDDVESPGRILASGGAA